jgi:hypothetical protein
MVTVLTDSGEIGVTSAQGESDRLWLTEPALEAVTGWSLRPEGLCRGDVCVPIPPDRTAEFRREGRVDAGALWRHLGKPALHSDDGSVWALGEGAPERAGALLSLTAPDFTLPDPAGRMHSLSDHRGKKVLLVSWASW